jgi:hypothetical protein
MVQSFRQVFITLSAAEHAAASDACITAAAARFSLPMLHAQPHPVSTGAAALPPHLGHVLRQRLLRAQALQALPELISVSGELHGKA